MGVAAYNRSSAVISSVIAREARERRNTLDERTRLWADLIAGGTVLTWKHPRGGILSIGPYQTATGSFGRYAVLSRHGDRLFATAWSAACCATTLVGRKPPRESD